MAERHKARVHYVFDLKIILSLLLILALLSSSTNFSKAQPLPSNASKAQPLSPTTITCKPVPLQSLVIKPDPNRMKVISSVLTNTTKQIREKLLAYEKNQTTLLRQDLQKLVYERKKVLVEAIRQNPDIAISFILSPNELAELHKISTNCVENFVDVTGKLQVQVVDLGGMVAVYRYDLITKTGTNATLHPAFGLKIPLRSGTEVRVNGFQVDNDIIFDGSSSLKDSGSATGLEVLAQPISLAIHGPQQVIVLLLKFADTSAPAVTTTQLQNIVFNTVNNFYKVNSYNDVSLSGTIFGSLVNLDINSCAPNDADLMGAVAAVDPQIDFRLYSHLVLVAPYNCLRGLGDIGAYRTIQTSDSSMPIPMTLARANAGDFSLQTVITHELGHNFKAGHARSVDCGGNTITNNFPSYNDCTFSEYGDPFDVMGPDWLFGHSNAAHMENYQWFSASNIQTVTYTGEPSKQYTLEPIEAIPPKDMQPHLKALKIPRENGDHLYIEYRQPIYPDNQSNFQSFSDIFQGASLHIVDGGSPSDPYLVDISPDGRQNPSTFLNSVLKVGRSFDDPGSGVRISVISADPNGLTVDVNFFPVNITSQVAYKFISGWGSEGSGDGRFLGPGGVVTDASENLYVVDGYRVQKFTSDGRFAGWLGKCTGGSSCDSANQKSIGFGCSNETCTGRGPGSGNGQFNGAQDIAIDGSGNLYILDKFNKRVQVFGGDGTFMMKWGSAGIGDGQFTRPSGIASDSVNHVIYVTDVGSVGHLIQGFLLANPCPPSSTQLVSGVCFMPKKSWGSSCDLSNPNFTPRCSKDSTGRITGNGQFGLSGPSGLAIDSSNNVYVTDVSNNRIQKFYSNGTFITKWGFLGSNNGEFRFRDLPQLAIDSSNNVYVTDDGNSRIQKFTSNGKFITKWGSFCDLTSSDGCNLSAAGAVDPGDGQFFTPYGVAFGLSGKVFVTDITNHRIQTFLPSLFPPFP
jgi:hypothetical protein